MLYQFLLLVTKVWNTLTKTICFFETHYLFNLKVYFAFR